MIAWLGMYDRPETAAAQDRFWTTIRDTLGFGPETLTRQGDAWEIWRAPDLVLAQTCGMPYRTRLRDDVHLIGTPDYELPGCTPGTYNSVLIVRADDSRPLTEIAVGPVAYNEALSQSGWAALWAFATTNDLTLGPRQQSGAHVASARMVATGQADIAAIDALTWAFIARYEPFAGELREAARTSPTPALPYITGLSQDPDVLFAAIRSAISSLSHEDRDILHLRGLIRIPKAEYFAVANPPDPQALTADLPSN